MFLGLGDYFFLVLCGFEKVKWGIGGRLRGKSCDIVVEVEWIKGGKGDILVRSVKVFKIAFEKRVGVCGIVI